MRRFAYVILVVLGACNIGGSDAEITPADLGDLATERGLQTRAFESVAEVGGSKVGVRGIVEDDYRYAATVSLNGVEVWQEVVADDHRYLRVLDATPLFAPEAAVALPTMHPAFPAVLSGAWVVDAAGAPPEFTPTPTLVPLGPELVLSQVRVLDSVPELVKQRYVEWDPNSAAYLPKDDKFPPHKASGKRFDHVPAGYDANRVVTTLDSVRPFFEYVSVWADDDGITRIERLMELPDPADKRYAELYEQLRRSGSRRLLALLDAGPRGRTLRSTYTIRQPGADERVTIPEGAMPVQLVPAITALRQQLAALAVPSPLYGPIE